MRLFIKIISTFLFFPLFIIVLLSGTVKFKILNDVFWINTFEKHDVYSKIQFEVNNYLDQKNANIFSELITLGNVKDFTNKNISLVVKFLNGKSNDLTFYIPVTKIPKEMLPKKLGTLKESMTAKEIIQKFNIAGIDPVVFDQFKNSGKVINYVFYISLAVLCLTIFFAYPVAIIFLGLILFGQNYFIGNINLHLNKILEIIVNPLIIEISKLWSFIGIALIIFAIAILVVKKFVTIKRNG